MSESTSYMEKTVRLPQFGGLDKDFQIWWMRFTVYAVVYGFTQAIGRNPDPDLPSSKDEIIGEETEEGKKQLKAKKANGVAVANLTMAFTTESLIGMVYKSMDENWLGGQAWKIVEALFEKHIPQDMVSKVELRRSLNKVVMKKDNHPSVLFETLSGIENKYNTW